MIDSAKIISKRLKNLRQVLGFKTQLAFAEALGIEKHTYNAFEKGRRQLSFDTGCLIRETFDIPIDWLFWGDDEEVPYHIKKKLRALEDVG